MYWGFYEYYNIKYMNGSVHKDGKKFAGKTMRFLQEKKVTRKEKRVKFAQVSLVFVNVFRFVSFLTYNMLGLSQKVDVCRQ